MGTKLVKGRFFDERDGGQAPRTIIVDRKLARRFWPEQDPIGRRLYRPTDIDKLTEITDKTVFMTVVGVVEDMKLHDLTEGDRTVGTYFMPLAQDISRFVTFAVKTAANPESLGSGVRGAIASLDREMPVFDLKTLDAWSQGALVHRRAAVFLSASFGLVALFLSAVGIYGVLGYLVVQRRKEIGIRMALGSTGGRVFELILREGLLLVAGGFLLGAVGAYLLRHSLESQLFGIRAGDPLVLGGVTAALTSVALLACVLPARRATRIDPVLALAE
jgi:putative ABC transport system permease protein